MQNRFEHECLSSKPFLSNHTIIPAEKDRDPYTKACEKYAPTNTECIAQSSSSKLSLNVLEDFDTIQQKKIR